MAYNDFDRDMAFHINQHIDMELNFDVDFYDQLIGDAETTTKRAREVRTQMDMKDSSSRTLLQYNSFLYRKELRRRKMNRCLLAKTKIHLTGGLLLNCEGRICDFSFQDIEAFTQGVVLKDRLVRQYESLYEDMDEDVEKDVDGKMVAKCNLT